MHGTVPPRGPARLAHARLPESRSAHPPRAGGAAPGTARARLMLMGWSGGAAWSDLVPPLYFNSTALVYPPTHSPEDGDADAVGVVMPRRAQLTRTHCRTRARTRTRTRTHRRIRAGQGQRQRHGKVPLLRYRCPSIVQSTHTQS
ncbi:hypothetical protein HYPSUDRAFT_362977 [Hypholoma sublateritium FD-334 SS-4]|uniref:Uncharacterized protein n=1 Tax=Hypholoma sublateritium (strain FD-334 SS-4) TaxID=945553 RepID=A0A0D2KLX5_HYPSF|nr:hypothetical protein HYPSUDRAFT_362977 [Hypholoma sublateritium FD-334 SS-4]